MPAVLLHSIIPIIDIQSFKKMDFNDAIRAWYDPDRLDFFDEVHSSENEIRWIFLGAVAGTVLLVIETEPDDDIVRIISARRALKHEQEAYYANRNKNT